MKHPEPRHIPADEMKVGIEAEFERDIGEEDILGFAALSGDYNPLHVDDTYARKSNYRARLVHGAFQVGLASAMVGMHLPGLRVLLGSIHARFPTPLYYPCRVKIRGRVVAWDPASLSGQIRVTVLESAHLVSSAEITMGFTLHEDRRPSASVGPAKTSGKLSGSRKVVLITGASGGLGSALCADLAGPYDVLALVNRSGLPAEVTGLANVLQIQADLAGADWEEAIGAVLGDVSLYGIVHAAWPGVPRGGLLDAESDALSLQLAFGSSVLVRLARLLFSRVGAGGGRLVALGSIFGHAKPVLSMSAYSLGKALVDDTVRLLAPELARKQITINAVCPSFIPAGMNRQVKDIEIKRQAAAVPMGRLCMPGDVMGAVRYLLSPEAAFVSGETIGLNGGQL